jgi:hypothetical protein
MSSTHPLQLYPAWTSYIVSGHRKHHTEDLHIPPHIHTHTHTCTEEEHTISSVTVKSLI